jgi:hypothetical protein
LQVAYYAACLCHPNNGFDDKEVTVDFVRIFDENVKMIPNAHQFVLDAISGRGPDIVVRSWGTPVKANDPFASLLGDLLWREWAEKYSELQDKIGFVDFGAAGNSGNFKKDIDIDYPQRILSKCNIIGSCKRNGKPSSFSGDGPGVQCIAWADKIYVASNKWSIGSGTSFACPKMAGLCAVNRFNLFQWLNYVYEKATRPEGYERSNKWGRGCMEDEYQLKLQNIPEMHRPPINIPKTITTSVYKDFIKF